MTVIHYDTPRAPRDQRAWRSGCKAQTALRAAMKEADDDSRLANERGDKLAAANRGLRNALYETDMTLVPAAWDADDLTRFDRLMPWRPGPDEADVRGFEWYYWNRQRHGELRTVALAGGFQDCQAAAFSPDGKWFAAVTMVDGAGVFRLWDAATGTLRRTLLKIPAATARCPGREGSRFRWCTAGVFGWSSARTAGAWR